MADEEEEGPEVADTLNDGSIPFGLEALTVGAGESAVTYFVTSFSDGEPGYEEYDGKDQSALWRGSHYRKTKPKAQMSIQLPTSSTALPAQFSTISYKSKSWVVLKVSPSYSYDGEPTFSLDLALKKAS